MPLPPSSSPGLDPSKWDPQVIAMVGLVCGIVVLFTYFKMIECNFTTLRVIHISRRLEHRRHLNDHLEEFSSTFQSRGLDSFVMHSLPITQVNKENSKESWHLSSSYTECSVCLGEFQDGEWVKHLPSCSHVFHVSCIDTWFQTHSSCPLCRSYVVDIVATHDGSPMAALQSLDREDYRRERLEHYQTTQSHTGSGNSRHE